MSFRWPMWDEWLAAQDQATRERSLALAEKFRQAGCADPDAWVRSEVDEDSAALAAFIFLRLIWNDALQPWRDPQALDAIPVAKDLLGAGADREKLWRLLTTSVSDAVWRTITLVDDVWVDPLVDNNELPGWRLMEVDRRSGELTGRNLSGLHEALGGADPEEREGDPFF